MDATIQVHARGTKPQVLSVFDLEVRDKRDDGIVVGVSDIIRGLSRAVQNQVDGLRKAGVSEVEITQLLVSVWPFRDRADA